MPHRVRFALAVLVMAAHGALLNAQQVRYDGQKVVRVHATTEDEVELALSLTDDVWSEAAGVGEFDMRVRPEQLAGLAATGISYEVLIDDVQQLIDDSSGGVAGADPFAAT